MSSGTVVDTRARARFPGRATVAPAAAWHVAVLLLAVDGVEHGVTFALPAVEARLLLGALAASDTSTRLLLRTERDDHRTLDVHCHDEDAFLHVDQSSPGAWLVGPVDRGALHSAVWRLLSGASAQRTGR